MDHVSRERRSAMMGAVKGKDTRPEMIVRRAAHRLGLRFRLHVRGLPGRPDLVLPKRRTVIFVNGCFWHGHPGCKRTTLPKSNTDFWRYKIADNLRRDADNMQRLSELGWRIVVIWECETKLAEEATLLLRAAFAIT